jgi:hypothetical protein
MKNAVALLVSLVAVSMSASLPGEAAKGTSHHYTLAATSDNV